MSREKRRKSRLIIAVENSRICKFFLKIAEFFCAKTESSLTGKLFSSYKEEADGLIHGLVGRLNLRDRFFRPVKRYTSRQISQSTVINAVNGFLSKFIYTKLNYYGMFLITAGIGFFAVKLLQGYIIGQEGVYFSDLFIAGLMVIASLPLLFSAERLNSAVCKSKIASAVVFGWLGCRRCVFEVKNEPYGHSRSAMALGLVFGVLSWWTSPLVLVLSLLGAVSMVVAFYIPETAVVGLLFLLPFLKEEYVTFIIIYALICFGLKYIRGKRTIRLDTLGVAVLLLFAVSWVNGRNLEKSDVVMSLCCFGAFFLTVNMIKSREWIIRCVVSLVGSFMTVSLIGILKYAASVFSIGYLFDLLGVAEAGAMESVFASSSVFVTYLVMVLPFVMVALNGKKRISRAVGFASLVLGGACLALTFEYRAWFSVLAGFTVFMILYGKRTFAATFALVCACPVVIANIPQRLTDKFFVWDNSVEFWLEQIRGGTVYGSALKELSFFGMGTGTFDRIFGSSDAEVGAFYRLVFESGVLGIILFSLIFFLCLQKNTTMYAGGCAKQGKLVSLATLASVVSFTIMGMGSDVFGSYPISVMFWICLGLSSCVSSSQGGYFVRSYEEYNIG